MYIDRQVADEILMMMMMMILRVDPFGICPSDLVDHFHLVGDASSHVQQVVQVLVELMVDGSGEDTLGSLSQCLGLAYQETVVLVREDSRLRGERAH